MSRVSKELDRIRLATVGGSLICYSIKLNENERETYEIIDPPDTDGNFVNDATILSN